MKKVILYCFVTLSSIIHLFATGNDKGYYSISIDAIFGELNTNRKLAGGVVSGGYNYFILQKPYLSIEPLIGVGFIGNLNTYNFNIPSEVSYRVTFFKVGLNPKLYLPLNPDKNVLLSFENEFALIDGFANFNSSIPTTKRKGMNLQFCYTAKLGLTIRLIKKCHFTVWVGGSTLKIDKILNRSIAHKKDFYNNVKLPYALGLNFYI